jgi:hypothetical protein
MGFDDVVLTFDTDWAPDRAIAHTVDILVASKTKATWFVTHDSPAVHELFRYPELFEIGVHPNFLEGSTQGSEPHDVMQHVMAIVPDARSVRTHGMVYSAALSRMFAVDFRLRVDSSIFLARMPHITPSEIFYGEAAILRIPYFWSDDGELTIERQPSFSFCVRKFAVPGLKVLCFHPIHVFLNSDSMETYLEWKRSAGSRVSPNLRPRAHRDVKAGTESLLREIIETNPNRDGFKTLVEVADEWRRHTSRKRQ